MINKLTVTNHLGESVTMELRFPEKSGFLIRGIEGLGPPKADINTTSIVTGDGSVFNFARLNSRNIVLTLDFLAFNSIEDSRQRSYRFFPIKRNVKMEVETDNRIGIIEGYVESNEVSIFSKNEGAIISILCPDPYFYSPIGQSNAFSTAIPLFEFPFSNEDLVLSLIEMGDMEIRSTTNIFYEGDAPVGVIIYIHAIGPASNILIINERTNDSLSIDSVRLEALTGSDIVAGDEIIISTIKGDKFVYLLRGGEVFNILNCLNKNPDWFQLEKGDNIFVYTADGVSTNLQFRIENKVAYEGV